GYEYAITRLPALWKWIYRLGGSTPGSPFRSRELVDILLRRLAVLDPAAVACTHPFYHDLIHKARKRPGGPGFPLLTVLTDSISIHSLWLRHPGDRICVADQHTAEVILSRGISADRLSVTGFPVHPVFTELAPAPAPDGETRPARLLYLPATSRNHVAATLGRLLEVRAAIPFTLTIVLGRHEQTLGRVIRDITANLPGIEVLGWTDQMPQLLCSHHLVVTKAGGATVNEAIAARCPLLLNYVVPGQEEGNAERVEKEILGAVLSDPSSVAKMVEHLLQEPGMMTWHGWRRRLEEVARPEAALTIAAEIREAGRAHNAAKAP
ncbi:MAG TPA: glycosyltransferase, partial [Verrucomicrobiales bacterium]|nr:glycosyltransferase [Verrucomicrobiales bacterium]